MGEGRCILLATVLNVHNSLPFYPYCQRCYSKLEYKSRKKLWHCSQCSNKVREMDVTYRFRLSMTIADRQGVADVSIFGKCLDNIFGSTANNFEKYLKHVEDVHAEIDANALLRSAANNSLNGNQFFFGFKVMCKTANKVKGLKDLICHNSRNNPRSIVACHAIQPFQNSQTLSIIQFFKHSIHCLSTSISSSLCSAALCYCKCREENKRQSFQKSSTFVCSGSSVGSQRKLSSNSLVISYEESLNSSNSQRILSQSSASDVLQFSTRKSLQTSKFLKPINEDGLKPYDIDGTRSSVFNNTNLADHKSSHKIGETEEEENRKEQISSSFYEDDGSIHFPDDLPFSEDLQMFLEKVDAEQVSTRKGLQTSKFLKPTYEDGLKPYNIDGTWSFVFNNTNLADDKSNHKVDETAENDNRKEQRSSSFYEDDGLIHFPDDLPFSEDLQMFLEKVDAEHAEGSMLNPDTSHNKKEPIDNIPDFSKNQLSLSSPSKVDQLSVVSGKYPDILQTLRDTGNTNLSFFNELPFSEDSELFLQQLETNPEQKSVASAKHLHFSINTENITVDKENQSQLSNCNKLDSHSGKSFDIKKKSVTSPCLSVMEKPSSYSTPIINTSRQSKIRNSFRQTYRRSLHNKQYKDYIIDLKQVSPDDITKTAKELTHKNHLPSFQNNLGPDINGNQAGARTESLCGSQEVSNFTTDLFSQSLFSQSCGTKEKSLKRRTVSKDLIDGHENNIAVQSIGKLSCLNNISPRMPHGTLQPCKFSTPKYQITLKTTSFMDSSKRGCKERIKESNSSRSVNIDRDTSESLNCLPSDYSPDLFSSPSIFFPTSVTKIDKSSLKTKSRSLSKDLLKRMIKLKQTKSDEFTPKKIYKPCVTVNGTKDMLSTELDVHQPDSENNSDVFTQQLFDSPSEPLENEISPKVFNVQNTMNISAIRTSESNHLYCSPDLFSQSLLTSSSRISNNICGSSSRISNNICGSPDLFSSWCEEHSHHPSNVHDDYNILSMQLFTKDID